MARDDKERARRGGRASRARRAPTADRGVPGSPQLREAPVSLDAEDIALARLQAHLRRAETIQKPSRPVVPAAARRTTLRLPDALIQRLRERAQRERTTPSEIVRRALEKLLRPR